MRCIVEAEDAQIADDQDGIAESDADLLLSGVDPLTDVADLQPDPAHTFRLWQLFLDRVNPLTKIIHVPTMQPIVLEATAGIQHLPLHHQALLFSIYILAIVSLSSEECMTTFGMTKDDALRRYTLGARVALNRFNFLKNENMAILQALVLFLVSHEPTAHYTPLTNAGAPQYSLPGRYDRYATWIVSGIVVRIAQKMGYHLDGEALGLPPFETEMRRRIWWQIVIRDATHTAVSGVSPSLLPADWDTKEPQNLNDADLFPNATEFPRPREGPTEMAFCLILHRAHKLIAEIQYDTDGRRALEAAVLGRTLDGKNTAGEIQWTLAKFRGLSASVDAELRSLEAKYLDTKAGPAHVAAHSLRSSLTRSLTTVLTPIQEQAEWGTDILTPEDNVFKLLITGYEHGCDTFDMMADLKFGWWMSLEFQTEGLTALTGQLFQRPAGSLSDRGWKVLDRTYHQRPQLLDTTVKKHRVQGRYALKAWEARAAALAQAGQDIETPLFVDQLQGVLGSGGEQSSVPSVETAPSTSGFEQQEFSPQVAGLDPSLGGFDLISWTDWGNVLIEADQYQMPGQGVPH